MKKRKVAAWSSLLGLALSSAAYADNAMIGNGSQKSQTLFEPGMPIRADQVASGPKDGKMTIPAGINLPGRIAPNGGIGVFATATFLYWMGGNDSLVVSRTPYNFSNSSSLLASGSCTQVLMSSEYKPGFKVAVGMGGGVDDWVTEAGYTYFHPSIHKRHSAQNGDIFLMAAAPYNIAGDRLSARTRTDMDLVDVGFSRPYYVGERMIFNAATGLRAAWLRLDRQVKLSTANSQSILGNSLVGNTFASSTKCNSWGLGPRFTVDTQMLLFSGLKLNGKLSSSTLFTSYQQLHQISKSNGQVTKTKVKLDRDLNTVRFGAETSLGLAWGDYFGRNKDYYLDLNLAYEWGIFFDQDMTNLVAAAAVTQSGPQPNPTNLVYHGPTVTLRLDF